MRQIDFFEVLENIDDKYIEEAANYKKVTRLGDKRVLIAAAASLIVLIGATALFFKIMAKGKVNLPLSSNASAEIETTVLTEETPVTTLPGVTEAISYEPVNDIPGTQFVLVSVRLEGDKANVTFTNISDEPWSFGEGYKLEVLIGSSWYYVPSEDYAVNAILYEIGPGSEYTMTYDLSPFGELAPGDYRISCGGKDFTKDVYYAYFTKTDDGDFIGTDPTGYPSGYTEET